ncbi:MAG: hypothetical protein HY904_08395 [Deltaproteobacteria bacterium]|nr:hypothetical protein [Deltaproteobacteria bacterium]
MTTPFRLGLLPLVIVVTGCPGRSAAPDGGRPESRLLTGLKQTLQTPPTVSTDGGGLFTYAVGGTVEAWAVNRTALRDVLAAVKLNSGPDLARALEKQPAVPPLEVEKARAVRGREPVGELALAALVGPLSLPFGGLHAPVVLERTGLSQAATPECRDTLLRPGAAGQVLAGVGRHRVVLLLDGAELAAYKACLDKAVPGADAGEAAHRELGRLRALLEAGTRDEIAVLVGLGAEG